MDRTLLPGRAPFTLSRLPVFGGRATTWCNRPFEQIRGKKKSSKQPVVVKVRLLRDVPRYGRQGAIIPIAAGRMRNDWYPRRVAEYMTDTALRDLDLQDSVFERDYGFRPLQKRTVRESSDKQEMAQDMAQDTGPKMEINLLNPDRSAQIISELVPRTLEFHRQPISFSSTLPSKESASKSDGSSSAKSAISVASDGVVRAEFTSIYGSVSALDIVKYVKTKLERSPDGVNTVPLSPEDIRFTSASDENEPDRVKNLGDFEIQIHVKGSQEPISRTVRVLPDP